MVGEEGLEPSLDCSNTALNRARLPVPPLARHLWVIGVNDLVPG